MKTPVKVHVDYNKCVGSTLCQQLAPAVFAMNEDGQAKLLKVDVHSLRLARAAADACPVEAIVIDSHPAGSTTSENSASASTDDD
jgi:ferredoxin